MLFILLIFALIRTLCGVPLASPSEPLDPGFAALSLRDNLGHFGQRGISDIIVSCFATLFACTWSAIHPNIPAVTDGAWTRFRHRVATMICALLAPELIIFWAFNQRMGAKNIMDEYNKAINNAEQDSEKNRTWLQSFFDGLREYFQAVGIAIYKAVYNPPLPPQLDKGKDPQWTLTHGFFLQMGGFMLCERGIPVQTLIDSTWGQKDDKTLIWNIQNRVIHPPRISEEEINDRSKGDTISKTFVILQTTWFIVQCIARWTQQLPVTELEVITLGFAMLNGITFALWWHKPQNVAQPVFLESRKLRGDISYRDDRIPCPRDSLPLGWLERIGHLLFYLLVFLLRILGVLISPVIACITSLGKMTDHDEVMTMGVGMFYSAKPDGNDSAFYATATIGVLFGFVHLIPAWFLDFPSRPEMLLWRISAILITTVPIFLLLSRRLYGLVHYFIARIFIKITMFIGVFLYPFARITLLALSLSTLCSLPPAALQTIEWTTFIPHF